MAPRKATAVEITETATSTSATVDQVEVRAAQREAALTGRAPADTNPVVLAHHATRNGTGDAGSVTVEGDSLAVMLDVTGVWGSDTELVARIETSPDGKEATFAEVHRFRPVTKPGIHRARVTGLQGVVRAAFTITGSGTAVAFSVLEDPEA